MIAAVRDVASSTSKSLASLPVGKGSKLITVKIDSVSETDARAAVDVLKSQHGITRLDTVIANAGIANYFGPALTTPVKEMHDHFVINTLAPLVLFQAVWPLLEQSKSPKFFVVSSTVGSIAGMESMPMPATAYGSSKAAVNYVVRKIHFEHPKLTAVALQPG